MYYTKRIRHSILLCFPTPYQPAPGGDSLDNFLNLRADKQEHIINAALNIFGRNGYKKASFAEIAEEAGIAKGMINYYFGSKKNLYLYLVEMCGRITLEGMRGKYDEKVTDFFDNLKMMIRIKTDFMKEHPAILSFMSSLHYETSEEVRDEIKGFIGSGLDTREKMLFDGIDVSRFKDDVNPKLLDKFLVWAAEGFTSSVQRELGANEIELFTDELYECLDLMKKYFYKEE